MHRLRTLLVAAPIVTAIAFGSVSCSKKDEPTPAAGSTTTAAKPGGSVAAAGSTIATASTTGSTSGTAAGSTKDTLKELGNSDIKKELSSSEPELWALVNYDYLSWTAFSGYNVILNVGADATKAVALCEAFSELMYDSEVYEPTPDTPIVIAVPTDANDFTGTPVAKRDSAKDSCKAA